MLLSVNVLANDNVLIKNTVLYVVFFVTDKCEEN